MLFANRVAEYQLRLTPADRALVALIEADPIGTSLSSAADLARRAGVHGATAGRLAKKLGYADWRALTDVLRDEHIRRASGRPVEPTVAACGTLDGAAHLGSVVDRAPSGEKTGLAALQDALQTRHSSGVAPSMLWKVTNSMADQMVPMVELDVGSIVDAAARRLCNARVVWISARGDFAGSGLLLRTRLCRSSLDARVLAEEETDRLAGSLPGDVILEVAGSLPENRSEGLRRCAVAKGLTVVLIGPLVSTDKDPPPAFHIVVPEGHRGDAVLAGQQLAVVTLASTVMKLQRRALPS